MRHHGEALAQGRRNREDHRDIPRQTSHRVRAAGTVYDLLGWGTKGGGIARRNVPRAQKLLGRASHRAESEMAQKGYMHGSDSS
jgi:hypothetical protein